MGWNDIAGFVTKVLRPAADVVILAFLIYKTYRLLLKTQAIQLVKGAIFLVFVYAGAYILRLGTLVWVLNLLAPGLVIGLAIVFQPELRKIFIRLGQSGLWRRGGQRRSSQVDAVLHAAELLAQRKRGALVVFCRSIGLDDIIERGTRINGEVSSALILSIFEFDTPLHDGALVVQGGRIAAAGCFLPLSEQTDIMKSFGTRHRAALGVSESADAVVLVVSEETGALSLAYDARLYYNLGAVVVKKRLERLLGDAGADAAEEGQLDE